ncbi:MAG TPA: protein translocase subunit SecD [Planctomycetota bacterium]|nr:protein translocase subunit SecD [Planctomycetota bacterium]
MVQNVGRQVALIAVLLITSLVLIFVMPLSMGLDLAGGTRLVYEFDIDDAREKGLVSAAESDDQILQQQIEIIRNRIDPQGVKEPILRRVGRNRIEISLPKEIETTGAQARAPLAQPLPLDGMRITLAGDEGALAGFPGNGGVVSIGSERVRYARRAGAELERESRGRDGTTPTAHEAGEMVLLVSDDAIRNAIENLGDLRFMAVATAADLMQRGTDENSVRTRLRAWLDAPENAHLPIEVFNELPPEKGGPPAGVAFFPNRPSEGEAVLPLASRDFECVVAPPPEWNFTGSDLARVFKSVDDMGGPAVGFEMSTAARVRFGDFTDEIVGERLAIILNKEVVSAPTIETALRGSSRITGRFTDRQVDELVTVLRSGSLRIKPRIVDEEKVGATLGREYVKRGFTGAIVAVLTTLLFMAVYYRRLGVIACIALACNLLMLMGAMVFLQATLTLPGIAGIILTVGMAVDANILIFDRLREEAEKGHKTINAAKEGFNNALSAIIDGNVTTLLTALILYNVGTGPIRGFAVTLSVGILTSMFAALVITRLLVHLQLERGVEKFTMARWMADANYQFVKHGKLACTASALAIVAGVTLFLLEPNEKKLGIDFLGGASIKVRTEQPMQTETVRALVNAHDSELSKADVAPLPSSAGEGGYSAFRVTFKTAEREDAGGELNLEQDVRAALADVLQKGPIEASLDRDSGRASVVLYFEEEHSVEDVRASLSGTPLAQAEVVQRAGQANVFEISGTVPAGTDSSVLTGLLSPLYVGTTDSAGRDFALANPIAEKSMISAQVVGELRDSAIRALLLSILLTVIYIRVRFAEYSYGFAAVVAVLHDILTTLAAVAVLIWLPFIQVEMNLTLIAAFLTIFGYSLNDTIVIFDRIRENLPRAKGTFAEIVDLSINQTLSRTIVTSGTTLATTLIVLAFNFGTGNALEGFGFALSFGLISGTYSTIFIACPLLIWLEERNQRKAAGEVPARTTPKPAAGNA